jgi:hypothetical protein
MQIIEGLSLLVSYIVNKVEGGFIEIKKGTLRYDEDRPLEELDLVHKKYLESVLPFGGSLKSRLTISGLTEIDWFNDLATDLDGNPLDVTWFEYYGRWPIIQCWFNPDENLELITLPIRWEGDLLIIDATDLTDVMIIIS